jgi:hypothetical protein
MSTIINGSSPSITFSDSTTQTTAGITTAPGTSGNVLTSNGSAWVSSAPSGGVTSLNGNTGALKGLDLVATTTLSGAVSTISFGSLPTGYSQFIIMGNTRVNGVAGGSDTPWGIRISINGGSSYISTGYYIVSPGWVQPNDGGAWGPVYTSSNTNAFVLAGDSGGAAGRGFVGGGYAYANFYYVLDQPSTNQYPTLNGSMWSTSTSGSDGVGYVSYGFNNNSTTYVNGVQLVRTGGNKNMDYGYVNIYGVKNA